MLILDNMHAFKAHSLFVVTVCMSYLVAGTDGLLCYSCADLKGNEPCFNVTECPSGEVCYGRADGLLTGIVTHTKGCTVDRSLPVSDTPGSITFCNKDCSELLCNLNECSMAASRPSRCMSCDLVHSPEYCINVTECKANEICFIQKVLTFGNIRYRLGCMEKQHCEPHVHAIIGKRSTPSFACSLCCDKDHCNSYACTGSAKDIGNEFSIKLLGSNDPCNDLNPNSCSTFNVLDKDACRLSDVVTMCPKSCATCGHVGWSSWKSWSACSTTCDTGTMQRRKDCLHQFAVSKSQTCPGSSVETSSCMVKHCPVSGGWCVDRNCAYGNTCYTLITRCQCPAPQYGGSCPPKPS